MLRVTSDFVRVRVRFGVRIRELVLSFVMV